MGKDLPVLLLDFSRKFSLLIPNIEPGKSFHSNNTSVEVLTKTLSSGQQISFMKFLFESPVLTIEAPVLSDRQMMYKVLKQNSACVVLECVLADVKKPAPVQQVEYMQQPDFVNAAPSQVIVADGGQVVLADSGQVVLADSFVMGMPKLPPGTIIVPQNGALQVFDPQQLQPQQLPQQLDQLQPLPQYYEVFTTSELAGDPFAGQPQEFAALPGQPVMQPMEIFETSKAFIAADAAARVDLFASPQESLPANPGPTSANPASSVFPPNPVPTGLVLPPQPMADFAAPNFSPAAAQPVVAPSPTSVPSTSMPSSPFSAPLPPPVQAEPRVSQLVTIS
jgi:hypothetical protein